MTFDAKQYMTKLQGKDYLEVKWRVLWFRTEQPHGGIVTEVVHSGDTSVVLKATVLNNEGHVIATAHGTADAKGKGSWAGRAIEKAETAAIGRALAHAGYGTQFTGEDEGENLADSPVERKQTIQQPQQVKPDVRDFGHVEGGVIKPPNPLKVMAQDTPSPKWSDSDAKAFVDNTKAVHKLTNTQITAALGISRMGEWETGIKEATAKLNQWLERQKSL